MDDRIEGLRATLAALEHRQKQAYREADRLRARRAPPEKVAAATADAGALQPRIEAVRRELEHLQLH